MSAPGKNKKRIRSCFWSNGVVVTRGSSALGIDQYLLAGVDNCSLSGQLAAVATPDLYSHMFFPGGVFRKHDIEMWITRWEYLPA
jgi:predicted acyl esterase